MNNEDSIEGMMQIKELISVIPVEKSADEQSHEHIVAQPQKDKPKKKELFHVQNSRVESSFWLSCLKNIESDSQSEENELNKSSIPQSQESSSSNNQNQNQTQYFINRSYSISDSGIHESNDSLNQISQGENSRIDLDLDRIIDGKPKIDNEIQNEGQTPQSEKIEHLNEQYPQSFIKLLPESEKKVEDSFSLEHPFKHQITYSKIVNDSNQSLSLTHSQNSFQSPNNSLQSKKQQKISNSSKSYIKKPQKVQSLQQSSYNLSVSKKSAQKISNKAQKSCSNHQEPKLYHRQLKFSFQLLS